MIWLLLCVVLNTMFFVLFKLFAKYGLDTFQAIVFNYVTCVVVGVCFAGDFDYSFFLQDKSWVIYALCLGAMFISTFFLMAKTVQDVSVTHSTVASKISMLIPSAFSLVFYATVRQSFMYYNYLGLFLTLVSLVFLTLQSKNTSKGKQNINSKQLVLVLAVFVGTGFVDTVLSIASKTFLSANFAVGFPIFCFAVAASIGLVVWVSDTNSKFEFKNLIGGICLGIPNYFSIYALIQGLGFYNFNAAFVYPIVHICSILLASVLAFVFFKEKLSKLNYVGVLLALGAVLLLSM